MVEFGILETSAAGGVGVFAIILAGAVLAISRARRQADFGTGSERALEREAGFSKAALANRKLQKREKKEDSHARSKRKKFRRSKGLPRSQASADEGAALEAKALGDTAESSEAIQAQQGRLMDVVSEQSLEERDAQEYVKAEAEQEAVERKEAVYINKVYSQLENRFASYGQLDSQASSDLGYLADQLARYVAEDTGIKLREKANMDRFLQSLNKKLELTRKTLRNLKAERGIFRKRERKEEKDYSGAISKLVEAVRKKERELSKAEKVKGADRGLIENLKRERSLAARQLDFLKRLQNEIGRSFVKIRKDYKIGAKILNEMKRLGSRVDEFDKLAGKVEADFYDKISLMQKTSSGFSKMVYAFQSDKNVHALAASLSAKMNEFLEEYRSAESKAGEFDASVEQIMRASYRITALALAYGQLVNSLERAEAAVANGAAVMSKLIESVISDKKAKASESEVEGTINDLRKDLNYAARLERYFEGRTKHVEGQIFSTIQNLRRLRARDAEILRIVEDGSKRLGVRMAHLADKKIRADQNYLSQAREFENQLSRSNAASSRFYRKARRTERRAA